jgi:hypothetical protein
MSVDGWGVPGPHQQIDGWDNNTPQVPAPQNFLSFGRPVQQGQYAAPNGNSQQNGVNSGYPPAPRLHPGAQQFASFGQGPQQGGGPPGGEYPMQQQFSSRPMQAAQGPPPMMASVHSGGWNNSPPPNNMYNAVQPMSLSQPPQGLGPSQPPNVPVSFQQRNSYASLAFQSNRPGDNMNQAPYAANYNSGGPAQMMPAGNHGVETVPLPFKSMNSSAPLSGPMSANTRPHETVPLPFGSNNSSGFAPQGTRPTQTVPLPFGTSALQGGGGQGNKPAVSKLTFKSIAPPRKKVLQPGETLEFTSRGVPYIKRQDDLIGRQMPSLDPSQEHKAAELSCLASSTKIGEVYGGPVIQYFNFLKFIICANVVFTGIGFISYGHHLTNTVSRLYAAGVGPTQMSGTSALDVLFISTYQPSSDVSFCHDSCLYVLLFTPESSKEWFHANFTVPQT